jgi:beta-lactamase superfamily II metal-dependent hydrolase
MTHNYSNRLALYLVAALVLACLPASADKAVFTFLDVGQGDGTLIECPGGERFILVDLGSLANTTTARKVAAKHVLNKIKNKDLIVVLTHPDGDHVNVLNNLFGENQPYKPKWGSIDELLRIVIGGPSTDYKTTPADSILKQYRGKIVSLTNQSVTTDESQNIACPAGSPLTFNVLSAGRGSKTKPNDHSIVLKAVFTNEKTNPAAVFLMADAEKDLEELILFEAKKAESEESDELNGEFAPPDSSGKRKPPSDDRKPDPRKKPKKEKKEGGLFEDSYFPRILKAGHHGSAGSSSKHWLEAVVPTGAVVSASKGGGNKHPRHVAGSHIRSRGKMTKRQAREHLAPEFYEKDGGLWTDLVNQHYYTTTEEFKGGNGPTSVGGIGRFVRLTLENGTDGPVATWKTLSYCRDEESKKPGGETKSQERAIVGNEDDFVSMDAGGAVMNNKCVPR